MGVVHTIAWLQSELYFGLLVILPAPNATALRPPPINFLINCKSSNGELVAYQVLDRRAAAHSAMQLLDDQPAHATATLHLPASACAGGSWPSLPLASTTRLISLASIALFDLKSHTHTHTQSPMASDGRCSGAVGGPRANGLIGSPVISPSLFSPPHAAGLDLLLQHHPPQAYSTTTSPHRQTRQPPLISDPFHRDQAKLLRLHGPLSTPAVSPG